MLNNVRLSVDNIRLAIWILYLSLLTVTATISVLWILRPRSAILGSQWHVPTPFWEHKSLESIMNYYDENAFRQPVGDLGKGILDQQSKEDGANEPPNNIYFSQQLASLECPADGKLTAPQKKFELNACTDFGNDFIAPTIGDNSGRCDVNFSEVQQVEKDDLDKCDNDLERVSSSIGCHSPFSDGQNMSEHIEVELNMTHTAVKNDEDMSIRDIVHILLQDLTESASKDKNDWIADKENIAMNPYAAPSETNVSVNEEPDQVPVFDGKRLTLQSDIPEMDKNCRETLLPNSTPSMSGNSSQNYVNSSVIQQVFFHVKRPTLLPDILEEEKDYRQTLLPNSSAETPQSLVLDVNDVPKSNDGMLNSKCKNSGFSGSRARRKKVKRDENEIPETVPVQKVVFKPKYEKASKSETTVFNDGACDMFCTQGLPANMMLPDKQTQQKCQTIKYENDSWNISDTQAFTGNVILPNTSPERQQTVLHVDPENPERRRTVTYTDTDNISVTQALLLLDDNKENNETENVLTTQSFSNNIVAVDSKTSRHRPIVYETGNISISQVKQQLTLKPGHSEEKPIVHRNTSTKARSKKGSTIVYDNDANRIFMTESISNIIAESKNERKSIVYDKDPASITMALAISANDYLLDELESAADIKKAKQIEEVKEIVMYDCIIEEAINKLKSITNTTYNAVNTDESEIFMNGAMSTNIMEESTNERKTMAYDEADSKNLAISKNVYLLDELESAADIKKAEQIKEVKEKVIDDGIIEEAINKIKTITCDEVDTDEGDISMTGAISTNIIGESTNERKTITCDEVDTDEGDISMTGAISTNIIEESTNQRKTITCDEVDTDEGDISMTGAISTNIIGESTKERKTITCDEVDTDEGDISMTGAISTNIIGESTNERKTITCDVVDSKNTAISTKVYLLDKLDSAADIIKPIKSISPPFIEKVIDYDVFGQDNLKPTENALQDNRKPTVFVDNKFVSDTSMTMGIATVPSLLQTEKRKTVIFGNDNCNISMNQSPPDELINDETELLHTTKIKSVLSKQKRAANPQSDSIVSQGFTTNSKQLTASINKQLNSEGDHDSVTKESLINISDQTLQRGTYDKSLMAISESDLPSAVIPQDAAAKTSTESMFYIMKNSELATQMDRKMDNKATKANPKEEEDEEEQVVDLQRQLSELKSATQNSALPSRSFEIDKRNEHVNIKQQSGNSSSPSDTQDLLDLMSDFTGNVVREDNVQPISIKVKDHITKDWEAIIKIDSNVDNDEAKTTKPKDEEDELVEVDHLEKKLAELKTDMSQNSNLSNDYVRRRQISNKANETQNLLDLISNFTDIGDSEVDVKPVVVEVKDQSDTTEHKRVSEAFNGQSIAFSRENILRNILMAQELLEKCRLALEYRECANKDTRDASVEISNKSDRRSYEVDKTFKFGDASISETSLTYEEKYSPLKKTAFGETSYMYETKGNVIPTYFKDVSDEIKKVMLDLVKPVSNDNMPVKMSDFTQNTSTHNAQMQANLATSSHKKKNILKPKQSPVLVFDHMIPLNNILLAPNYSQDEHKYNPRETDRTRCGSRKLLKKISEGNNYEAETLSTTQYNMMSGPSTMQDDISVSQKEDRFGKKHDQFWSESTTTTRGCIPVDQSVDAISTHLRNDKVNTNTEMTKKEKLLRAGLSLDLVEDASEDTNRALTSDSNKHKNLKLKLSISPHFNINGEATKIVKTAKLSGISIRPRFNCSNSRVSVTNSKTRICNTSKDKHEQYSPSEEVTAEPIPKISISSKPHKVSKLLSSPGDHTKPLRTEETYFIFVEQSFQPASPVFDRLTPVNNILHSPTDITDGHKNDPRKTDKKLFGSASGFNKMSEGDNEVQQASTTTQTTMVTGKHTDDTLIELVNTLHAMVNDKSASENEKWDSKENENRVLTPDKEHSHNRIKSSRPVLVDLEGQSAGIDSIAKTTRQSLGDQNRTSVKSVKKGKKQIFIPSTDKYKQFSPSVKVTRKSITKMQKFSTNPKPRIESSTAFHSTDDFTHSMAPEKDVTKTNNRDAHSSAICEKKSPRTKKSSVFSVDKPCEPVVLVFDHLNPLNNVLLVPSNLTDVHKYNPKSTDSSLRGSGNSFNKISEDNEAQTVTTTKMPESTTVQDDIYYIYQKSTQSGLQYASSTGGSISVEESRDGMSTLLRNDEINTAKTANHKLHKARSSLTSPMTRRVRIGY